MDASTIVHIVDDDDGARDSLRMLLETAGFTVRSYASAAALLDTTLEPLGCVLSDIRMPEIDGLELQHRLTESGIHLPVILMTAHGDVHVAVNGMKAGAVDFLEKPFGDEELFGAVRRALKGSRKRYAEELTAAKAVARLLALTPREHDVFELLIAGSSTKAIARALHISPRTADVHRARVFAKLYAENLPELVRLAIAVGPEDMVNESPVDSRAG